MKIKSYESKPLSSEEIQQLQDWYSMCQKAGDEISYKQEFENSTNYDKIQSINSVKANIKHWVSEYNKKTSGYYKYTWSHQIPYNLSVEDFIKENKE